MDPGSTFATPPVILKHPPGFEKWAGVIPVTPPSRTPYSAWMGLIKQAKANVVTQDAARAAREGRSVFTPRLNSPMTHHGMSGVVPDWAEMIEGIEAEGWRLDHWVVARDQKDRPEAYPLFRRA